MNVQAAHVFAVELRKAQEKRNVTTRALAAALGMSQRHVVWWRYGRSLPYLASAARVADALDWPVLVDIVRRARGFTCRVCGRRGVSEGTGAPRRYCDEGCRTVARKARLEGRVPSIINAKLAVYSDAVGSMCLDCNPGGLCRDATCALRPVSPLPLADGILAVAQPVDGRRSRWDDPTARRKASEAMRAIHERTPEWREQVSAKNRERWAAMTPEERKAIGRRISAGVRAARRAA